MDSRKTSTSSRRTLLKALVLAPAAPLLLKLPAPEVKYVGQRVVADLWDLDRTPLVYTQVIEAIRSRHAHELPVCVDWLLGRWVGPDLLRVEYALWRIERPRVVQTFDLKVT